ncbi:MAG: VOC family protein [Cyclobacteriaceae bacterium]|nr:VOC family protein [Cyclobacteriaceae bacterium]MCB0498487.1 VOC family protein [Cyclobacteriaceae bacterium]MCB9236946.1 VOC family protein [Flammeovirgaceae bacterium]MCO5273210.1 VOC family protein [Cyclobacteriaceae bacterium]MCW5901347.1 VOC family protein [Cyclobacteriaceae bacterium]
MKLPIIAGIQQVGIGVADAEEAWAWYRKHFDMSIPIFKDKATASLMTRYTNGKAEDRFAILAINGQGGGGFEIWQYTSKEPQPPRVRPSLGDTGVYAIKIKSRDIGKSFSHFESHGIKTSGGIQTRPDGKKHFFVNDPYHNTFQVTEGNSWLKKNNAHSGGVAGCMIGVSNIDQSLPLYQSVLGHGEIAYDHTGVFDDFSGLPGEKKRYRRVALKSNPGRSGAFSRLLGDTELELVEALDEKPKKIFEDRCWGDLGFIHVCFDVHGMEQLGASCAKNNFPFTVDSSHSFDMGKAAGHFTYCEDPDGTLIEFVETHKIPIMEKLGWYLNVRKRDPSRPLPDWFFTLLGLTKVKN